MMAETRGFRELLREKLSEIAQLSAEQVETLCGHYQLLARWNRSLNLTAIRNLHDVVVRHYCESLFLGSRLPATAVSVLDVGTGGGFPGIPMAVLRPDCCFTLAESHRRKAVFLREATRGWHNVHVFPGRAESICEQFDWVVARAVRWEEVLKVAARLGRCLGLLLGTEDAARAAEAAGVAWEAPVRLPWGRRRVLLIGSVARNRGLARST